MVKIQICNQEDVNKRGIKKFQINKIKIGTSLSITTCINEM